MTTIEFVELDPELSASTGLTNDVCGRLAIFSGQAPSPVKVSSESEKSDSENSAFPTPCKVDRLLSNSHRLLSIIMFTNIL